MKKTKNTAHSSGIHWIFILALAALLAYLAQNTDDFESLFSIFSLAFFKSKKTNEFFNHRYHQLCTEKHSLQPANKIKNGNYQVALLPQSGLYALKSAHRVEWKKIEEDTAKIYRVSRKYRQQIQSQMEAILGEKFANLPDKEHNIIFALHALLGDSLAVNETQLFICDSSVSISIAKIIVDHYRNKTKISPLIGVGVKYGALEDFTNYHRQHQFKNGHFLDSHAFLLIAPQNDREMVLQLKKLNIDGYSLHPLTTRQKAIALLEILNPQICDLWNQDSKLLTELQPPHSVIGHLKQNPQYLHSLQIIMPEDLELSKRVKKILNFFVNKYQKLWDEFLKKSTKTGVPLSY